LRSRRLAAAAHRRSISENGGAGERKATAALWRQPPKAAGGISGENKSISIGGWLKAEIGGKRRN